LEIGEQSFWLFQTLHQGLLEVGNPEEAWFVIQTGLEVYPNNSQLMVRRKILSQSVKQKIAILHFLEGKWMVNNALSLNQLEQGYHLSSSIQDYKQASIWSDRELLQRRNWESLSRKGMALTKLGDFEDALTFYEEALTMEPSNTYILNNVAWLLNIVSQSHTQNPALNHQRQILALEMIEKAISLSRLQEPSHYDTLAGIYCNMGKRSDAILAESKALALDENNDAYQQRLQTYLSGCDERSHLILAK